MTYSPTKIETKISGHAIAALYLSITALVIPVIVVYSILRNPAALRYFQGSPRGPYILFTLLSLFSIVLAAVSVVAGWNALWRIKGSEGTLKGKGRGWAGLVVGCLGILVYLIVFVLSNASVDRRVVAKEAATVGNLRRINDEAEIYRATYQRGYPMFLSMLGPPTGGAPRNSAGADLIDERLASGEKSGYLFIYQITAMDENHLPIGYVITAMPREGCGKGGNCYLTDETGVIRVEVNRTPDQHSPPIG